MKRYRFGLEILFTILIFNFFANESLAQDSEKGSLSFGIKGGVNLASFHYTVTSMREMKDLPHTRPTLGLMTEYTFNKRLTLGVEALYLGKGCNIHQNYEAESFSLNYVVISNYAGIRMPVSYNFSYGKNFRPYFFISPEISYNFGGKITFDFKDNHSNITLIDTCILMGNANMRKLDIAGVAGIGFRTRIKQHPNLWLKFDAAYHLGFLNTYSDKELAETISPTLINAYNVSGKRLNQGFEISCSFIFTLKGKNHSDNTAFDNEETTIIAKEETTSDTINHLEIIPDVHSDKEVAEYGSTINANDCYPLEEILEMIRRKEDISQKKICSFDDITFEFGKANLKKESYKYLNKIVLMLRKSPQIKIEISGHTDNVGSEIYNQKLSEERAKAVYDYFIAKGINAQRLKWSGFGSQKPIGSNFTYDGKARNRRVEFKIVNDE